VSSAAAKAGSGFIRGTAGRLLNVDRPPAADGGYHFGAVRFG